MKFVVDFQGETYEEEEELLVAPGSIYTVEWERGETLDDYDMHYMISNQAGWEIEAQITYNSGEVLNPSIEDLRINSNREEWSDIEPETFEQLWEDVRSARKIR